VLESVSLVPIGYVRSTRTEPEDDAWGDVESVIAIDERFPLQSLAGLDDFSHVEVVYLFHRVDPEVVTLGARHPRGLEHLPRVGVFAQRNKNRPNRIGVSRCSIVGIDGRNVTVRGLDAIDGTPVLDLKPHFAILVPPHNTVREPEWVEEIMREYF
jgi:tRNA-Thr(GGU) m(6)t(6)A37 methyltransferase TsaA